LFAKVKIGLLRFGLCILDFWIILSQTYGLCGYKSEILFIPKVKKNKGNSPNPRKRNPIKKALE